jgi:hypothetical protein
MNWTILFQDITDCSDRTPAVSLPNGNLGQPIRFCLVAPKFFAI